MAAAAQVGTGSMRCHTEIPHEYDLTRRPKSTSRRDLAAGWYEEFSGLLVGYLSKLIHSVHDAEEIAQEAFLHVLSVTEPILNPKAMLFTTAQNLLRDHCRRAHTRAMSAAVPIDEVEVLDSCEPSQVIESEQALAGVVNTLAKLRPPTRKAFLLHRVELRSHAEIAARLRVTNSMVEKHIKYAMDAFEAIGFEQPRHAGGRRREVMSYRAQRINVAEARADQRTPRTRRRKTEAKPQGETRRAVREIPMPKRGGDRSSLVRGRYARPDLLVVFGGT